MGSALRSAGVKRHTGLQAHGIRSACQDNLNPCQLTHTPPDLQPLPPPPPSQEWVEGWEELREKGLFMGKY